MAKSASTSVSRKRATPKRRKVRRERTPTVCTETDAIVPLQSTGKTPAFAEARLFAAGISSVGQIVYFDQTEANGGFDKMPTAIDPKQIYNEIAVGRTLDGRLSIAAQRQTGFSTQFITESKSSTSAADRWNKPVDLGKPMSVNFFKQLIVLRGVDGLDNVFGVDVSKSGTDIGG